MMSVMCMMQTLSSFVRRLTVKLTKHIFDHEAYSTIATLLNRRARRSICAQSRTRVRDEQRDKSNGQPSLHALLLMDSAARLQQLPTTSNKSSLRPAISESRFDMSSY